MRKFQKRKAGHGIQGRESRNRRLLLLLLLLLCPSSSSSSSSCSCSLSSSSQSLNFSSGINYSWKHQGFRAQAMSTTAQGSFGSCKNIVNGKNEPDHPLVLVHGILASPSDWTYVEGELKR
ncbi:hypothetical protein SLE2022_389080 [Rubroshorea leprosula]